MNKTNIRNQLYGLLYHKPMFNYAKMLQDKKNINVLIVGNDPVCVDVFKAVFWCGQMPAGYALSFTVASEDPRASEEQILHDLPALNGGVVPVDIKYVDFSSVSQVSEYGVVFITEKDAASTDSVFNSLISRLNSEESIDSKILVCFCREGEYPENGIRLENGFQIDVCSFSTQWDMSELEQYAFNINFAYNLGTDERSKRPNMADFVGAENQYNHDSSFAGAVHIPYKLRVCEEYAGCNKSEAYSVLSKAIAEHDKGEDSILYNMLLELEHRRWSAYMIGEGWQMPSDAELVDYAYRNGNDHRNKAQESKRHPCLCLGSENGSLLNLHYNLWSDDSVKQIFSVKEMIEFLRSDSKYSLLTELDAVSLVLHNIAHERAKDAIQKYEELFAFIEHLDSEYDRKPYENLLFSARKLRDDEPNSVKLYLNALNEAKKQASLDNLNKAIDLIEKELSIVVIRNRKTDFFDIDAAMIDMLPFCIWYGKKYKTVITFSNGIPVEDIIVPTVLSAEKTIFICRNGASELYKKVIQDYFSNSRGGYTQVLFDHIDSSDIESIVNKIDTTIAENAGAVINWIADNDAATSMAIGIAYNRPYMPVFRYEPDVGVVNIKDGCLISTGLGRKSLSIDEFVALMGGEYRNVYKNVGHVRDFDSFKRIFFEYIKEREYITREGKKENKSVWNAMSNVFQASSKDVRENWTDKATFFSPKIYRGSFPTLLFDSSGLQTFLSSLFRYRIIVDYTCEDEKGITTVIFKYVDKALPDLLEPFTSRHAVASANLTECEHRQLKFIPNKGIVSSSVQASNISYGEKTENKQFADDKAGFLRTLEELGLIKNLDINQYSLKTSFEFKNIKTSHLFKTQGKVFELILYNQFKNSGLFDDVQTSVQVCWDLNTEKEDAIVLKRIQIGSGIGYQNYRKTRQKVRDEINDGKIDSGTENEIDIVLTCGMTPVFVSCKTGNKGETDWLNEISSLAAHFHARPVLAVTKDLTMPKAKPFLARARKMGVSVIGIETFLCDETMMKAMLEIKSGNTVIGKNSYRIV